MLDMVAHLIGIGGLDLVLRLLYRGSLLLQQRGLDLFERFVTDFSAGGGSGDNSERYGDMSGSLASQEVKPSGSAGTNGREDRGRSSSVGRSGNHGQSGATATTSDTVSAAQKAASGGPWEWNRMTLTP